MITRGRGPRYYWENFSGLGDLAENLDMVALTWTLTLVAGDTTITGVGTLFNAECHLGQFICAITVGNTNSWPLVVKRIVSDTEMVVWRALDSSAAGVVGWRMGAVFSVNDQRGTVLRGNFLKLDKGSTVYIMNGKYTGYIGKLKDILVEELKDLKKIKPEKLIEKRIEKFAQMGEWEE